MGKVASRESEILELLKKQRKLDLSEIVGRFGISDSTARRLCISLERQGRIIRGFGGIYSVAEAQGPDPGYQYDVLVGENAEEKRLIGAYASTLVENGDIIFISGGTTVAEFSRQLAARIGEGLVGKVLITTNSIINAELLSPHTKVVLIGGEYRPHRRDVAGFLSEKMIANVHFNKCFLGIDAIDVNAGLMVFDVETGNLDEHVSSRSDTKYILADSQKFKKKSFITYSTITPTHVIVTDGKVDPEIVRQGTANGFSIITV
jgi:DeoR/GlpR family transcriptional regulator of sugar metabolism